VIADLVVINAPFGKGAEVDFLGWPKRSELEPINVAAQRVADYYNKRRTHPCLPKTPWNNDLKAINLPAVLPASAPETRHAEAGSRLPNPVVKDPTEDMPRYRARYGMRVGKYHVDQGMFFHFLGWPEDGMDPDNTPAERVVLYFGENRGNPKLLPSPWCEFISGLLLPKLPAAPEMPGRAA
jgi:hypothetical protein